MSIAEREGMGWEVQSRLLAWRDRELAWACRRYRAVGQATLEVLLDRAADAVVANVGASVAAGGRPPGDRDLRALWRKAFREQVKGFRRTEAARRSVDVFDAACETVAGVSGAGVERVVALEAVQIECEFESSLSERERRVLRLRRAGASAIDIRRELSIDRRQVAALDYALDAKRQLFEHELATGELCRVRQRFIARLATGDGGPRMRSTVALHAVWCPRCRRLLAVSCREAARRALGVFAPVPVAVGRVWRSVGSSRPGASSGGRVGEVFATRLPEMFGGVGSACATAGACALLAGGATVAVREISVPAPRSHHRLVREHHARARVTSVASRSRVGVAVVAAEVVSQSPSKVSGVRWTRVRSASASPGASSSSRVRRRSSVTRLQAARATGQFGQPGTVAGGGTSSGSSASIVHTAYASSGAAASTGSSAAVSRASSSPSRSGPSGGQQFFRP